MPKGVISKVGPVLADLLETVPALLGHSGLSLDEVPNFVTALESPLVSLPAPPLMHNTGLAIGTTPALATGGTVVLLESHHFDASSLWDAVAEHAVTAITVVGDPFARPMLKELEEGPPRDLSAVRSISSSGAMFSTEIKAGLLGLLPNALIIDIIAATEGRMGMSISANGALVPTGQFRPDPGVIVVAEGGRVVEPGSGEAGQIALPGGAEGYYQDDAKTAATFRIIDGRRFTIPGDFATVEADGTLVLLGRGSSCINTAGEKVYPEEVEEVLKALPWIEDALVFGIDDERFGQKVAAVVSFTAGSDGDVDESLARARTRLASYKLPRVVVVADEVPRTQVGKADYPAARQLLELETGKS
jgi:fatty-acyl-CoA synthase